MIKEKIQNGKVYLGIEFGSTRIKACLIDDSFAPIAGGSFDWENKFENGFWTYDIVLIHKGLTESFSELKKDVSEKYGVTLTHSLGTADCVKTHIYTLTHSLGTGQFLLQNT